MNIVFLRSGYGKPDSRFEKEVSAIIEAGHNVNIIAWDRKSKIDIKHKMVIFSHSIPCIHIGVYSNLSAGFKKNFWPMFKFNLKLYIYLKKNQVTFDAIHACDFDTVLPAYFIKKRLKKKLIYDIYDYYTDSHNMPNFVKPIVRKIDTKIINNSDVVIICNEKRIEQILPATPRKLFILHNSPELNLKNHSKYIIPKKEKFRIVYIGGIVKTGRYIFEMINVIKERNDCELIIGGYGVGEKEILEISQKNTNIMFVGKQNYIDVLNIEASADILTALYDPTVPNHKYAAPNKFYEALMLGKPLICVKNTNIDNIIIREKLGWVLNVPKFNFEDEFNRALDLAIKCTDEYEHISERAKKIFAEKYDWKIMKKRLAEIYKSI